MAHIVHQRLVHALSTLNKDMETLAERINYSKRELDELLASDTLVPLSVLTNICNASGVCRDYALLNRGPMTPVIKTPLNTPVQNDQPSETKTSFELFLDRLTAVMDAIPLNDSEIGDVIGLSKQSVGRWRKTGMISEENLRAVCAIEGFDFDWVKTGIIDTEEAQDTYDRVFAPKLSDIDAQIAKLQEQKKRMQG